MDRFKFPINLSLGRRTSQTYASVTGSIIKKIREAGHGMIYGKPVCPPIGQFQIVLNLTRDSGLSNEHNYGKVRLLFSYPDLYLEAFSSGENWYRFSDVTEKVVPGCVSQALPFESGYSNRGVQTDFSSLRFGKTTMIDIYKALGAYPNNTGGLAEIQVVLSKVAILFSEAIRFPELRRFLVYLLKAIETKTVKDYSDKFQNWGAFCKHIRAGREAFNPTLLSNESTFEHLLSLVAVLLHKA